MGWLEATEQLLSVLRIDDDGDRTVIGETEEHISAELTGVNRPAHVFRDSRDELLV